MTVIDRFKQIRFFPFLLWVLYIASHGAARFPVSALYHTEVVLESCLCRGYVSVAYHKEVMLESCLWRGYVSVAYHKEVCAGVLSMERLHISTRLPVQSNEQYGVCCWQREYEARQHTTHYTTALDTLHRPVHKHHTSHRCHLYPTRSQVMYFTCSRTSILNTMKGRWISVAMLSPCQKTSLGATPWILINAGNCALFRCVRVRYSYVQCQL